MNFIKISYINLSKKGIESLGPSVITLANYEGLAGHAQSVIKELGENKFVKTRFTRV